MKRWVAATVVMLAAVAVVVGGRGPAGVALWEGVVVAALMVVGWRARSSRPPRVAPLFGDAAGSEHLPPGRLATIELEVAGATDPRLRGAPRLRRRLIALAEHRAGVAPGALNEPKGQAVLGQQVWETLMNREGVLTTAEVEMLVARIEAL